MTKQTRDSIAQKTPPLDHIEGRFAFIGDDTLRRNITIAVQYIIFLIAILDEEKADDSTISSSIHKDMILYTASIVEGCLHYCLQRYITTGSVVAGKVMPSDWITKNPKPLYEVSSTERIIGATQVRSAEKLKNNTQFIVINKAARKASILTQELFDKANHLREMRNAIHLKGLRAVDDLYTKEDAQRVFEYARAIIERIETKINALEY